MMMMAALCLQGVAQTSKNTNGKTLVVRRTTVTTKRTVPKSSTTAKTSTTKQATTSTSKSATTSSSATKQTATKTDKTTFNEKTQADNQSPALSASQTGRAVCGQLVLHRHQCGIALHSEFAGHQQRECVCALQGWLFDEAAL